MKHRVKARQTLFLVLTFTDAAHWSSHLTTPKAKQTRAKHHRLHTKVIKEDGGHLRELVWLNKKKLKRVPVRIYQTAISKEETYTECLAYVKD